MYVIVNEIKMKSKRICDMKINDNTIMETSIKYQQNKWILQYKKNDDYKRLVKSEYKTKESQRPQQKNRSQVICSN